MPLAPEARVVDISLQMAKVWGKVSNESSFIIPFIVKSQEAKFK
jgi:hypothetical protein